jgi:uncharacterized protein (DUF488 family)
LPGVSTAAKPARILTVGHSNRPVGDFLALLEGHGVRLLGDVRTVPQSRHNPQFGQQALAQTLAHAGIEYRHFPALGGLRKARKDSVNGAWRNASFRGYADHMASPEFACGLSDLIAEGGQKPTAIMCAEAVPWRCHRSLIADALIARGIEADEIVSPTSTRAHRLTPFARVTGTEVTYPALA